MTHKLIRKISIYFCMCLLIAGANALSASEDQNTDSIPNTKNMMFRMNTMCGPNCIWQIAKAYGKEYPLKDIAKFAGTNSIRGTTVQGMLESCQRLGLRAKAVKTNMKTIARDRRVAILLLKTDKLMHYVILDRVNSNEVRLLDGIKFRVMSIGEFESIWTGVAILIGDQKNLRTGRFQRYFGRSLQISGLLIILAAAAYGIKRMYSFLIHQ